MNFLMKSPISNEHFQIHSQHVSIVQENHYKSEGSNECVPCQCYAAGSMNSSCSDDGQCHCRVGVIGRACDACANLYAEVAPNAGCEGIFYVDDLIVGWSSSMNIKNVDQVAIVTVSGHCLNG